MKATKISDIHLETKRLLKLGHPWITADSYSLKFPKDAAILEIIDQKQSLGFFLHDPLHPKIKARFWSNSPPHLDLEIKERLQASLLKRQAMKLSRDNYYLVFAEADRLPGLYIQKLGEVILVQYQSFFWEARKLNITKLLNELGFDKTWWQARLPAEQKLAPVNTQNLLNEFVIAENEIKFLLKMDQGHDIGIYSDMSAIREKIKDLFQPQKKLLNLFSYTGAFSLLGLKQGMEVCSVDLSKKYMTWLEQNIELNQLKFSAHQSKIVAVDKFLSKTSDHFDLIVCDPPSFSSNKKTRGSSFDFYQEHLEKLYSLLTPNGRLLIFLNTHQLNREKFRKMVQTCLPKVKIERELGLGEDCPTLSTFPEGDYLKGLVLLKNA
jgi:23S rRNA (cytosine1962-C5)-methyltransferase